MYNSYLEYVLDNPVNDNDFTKTAGILDAVKGLAGKLVKKPAAEVAKEPAKTYFGYASMGDIPDKKFEHLRKLREKVKQENWLKSTEHPDNWQREHLDVLDKAARKHFFPNGIKDVHPTSVTRNADGARVLKYENPYWDKVRELNVPYRDARLSGITGKARAYDKLLAEKRHAMATSDVTKNNKVRDITFGSLNDEPGINVLKNEGFGVRVGKPMSREAGKAYYPGTFHTSNQAFQGNYSARAW